MRQLVDRLRKVHEAKVLESAERSLAQATTYGDCPPPLSWHPFYRGKTWLIDWLNGKSDLPEWDIVLPATTQVSALADMTEDPIPMMRTMRMTKRRAWGQAAWTGRPFHYEWYVGTDEVGRHVAGESRIVYEDH